VEESVKVELLMETTRPVTLVVPQTDDPDVVLLPPPLLLKMLTLTLQAYPPRYNENDPPYELPP